MNTKCCVSIALVVASLAGRSLLAGEAGAASRASALLPANKLAQACCAAEKPQAVADACCAATPAPRAVAPLSDRSIYQLDATWTDDAGRPFALAALRGRPVVLAMFFASCGYACPMLVNDMRRISDALPAGVRAKTQFVLVSFDSERDTPEALRLYRERSKLDAAQWTLLHGEADNVQELAMLLGVQYQRDSQGNYAHSNLITVLTAGGEILHQRGGLQGEVADAVRAVTLAAK